MWILTNLRRMLTAYLHLHPQYARMFPHALFVRLEDERIEYEEERMNGFVETAKEEYHLFVEGYIEYDHLIDELSK